MIQEASEVALLLNLYLFDPIARAFGFTSNSAHPHALPDHIVMALLIALGLIVFSVWFRRRLSVDNPSSIQHLVEVALEAVQGLMRDVIGRDFARFTALIGTLALYILISNPLGLVPGFISPTSNLNVTASCAICVFFYYNYHGLRKHGFLGYMKHFAGPVWWLAPMLFVVELVSHLARPFSLSVRLFGNIFAEELVIGSLNNFLFPFLFSIPVMFLALFLGTIQAFIFILLTMVYLSGAVEEGHDGEHAEAHNEGSAHAETQTAAA
jgi:F-type H+-transporting ATPase subunit a